MKDSIKLALLSTLILFIQGFAIGYFSTYITPSITKFTIKKIFFFLFFWTMGYFSYRHLVTIITINIKKPKKTSIHFKKRKGTNIIDLIPKKKKWFNFRKKD